MLLLASLLAGSSLAQDRLFKTIELDGFPRGNVQDIVQDKYGFLWIATSDGLGKYDGHQLIDYRHLPYDTNSLSSNYITDLSLDRAGNILVSTRNGITVYLMAEDRFIRLVGNEDLLATGTSDIVLNVIQDHRGWYWYGTYHGLFRRKHLNAPAELIFPNEEHPDIPHKTIWKIHQDKDQKLWIGSGMGLVISDTSAMDFTVYERKDAARHGLNAMQTWDFVELENGTLYLGSENGIYRAELVADGYHFHQVYTEGLSEPFVNCMHNDGDSILWIGNHREGLNEIDLRTGTVRNYRSDEKNEMSIARNGIQTVFRDRNGLLWVGASGNLQYTSRQFNNFQCVTSSANSMNSLSNEVVKSSLVDHQGTLWVGTYDGLNRSIDTNWRQGQLAFDRYSPAASTADRRISHGNMYGLYEDSRGILWAATFRGLNYLDLNAPRTEQQFTSLSTEDGLPHYFIYELQEIYPGQYWVATYGKLARMYFDPEEPRAVKFDWFNHGDPGEGSLVNATVYTMTKDRFGRWWFGTFDGLSQHRFNQGEDFFDNYQRIPGDSTSLSDNSIRCLHLDSQGRLWVGTRTGLNLVIQKRATDRAKFQHFGLREGFPNDVIHFIEEDAEGIFWIGTNAGLVRFNPDAALAGQAAVEEIYTQADGLLSSSFVFRSSSQDSTGQIYLGTGVGLNIFHPQRLLTNQYAPKIALTQLEVNGTTISPSTPDQNILQLPIQETEQLKLHYQQNQIGLSFSALDYYAPEDTYYQYRLLGFHDNWLGGRGVSKAQYTRLPPGNYTLQVKAANSDGIWGKQIRELAILIQPPWWNTTLAYICYVLVGGGVIWWLINQRIQRQTQKLEQEFAVQNARSEERTRLRQKNAADFHDELGHRLTKISLFLELAKRNIRQPLELFTHFEKIKQHVDGLSSGMRDLIWALDPEKDNVLQTMMRLRDFGEQLFEDTTTQFRVSGFTGELEAVLLQPDTRQQLLLLFKEAMHNCLKYAQASEAKLKIERHANTLRIIFYDNGQGFVLEDRTGSGYGLKNMQQRAEKMGAQLIIQSTPGKGTTLTLDEIPQMG
ncbi:MAG: two-component regulator propeller domain-containing protein [Bacteroidota bacterium]